MGVLAGLFEAGRGAGGLLAQANRAAVALGPLLADQRIEQRRFIAGELLERGADRLADQLERGQVACVGQDVGGIGARRPALLDHPCRFDAFQGEVEQHVRAAVLE